MVYAADLKSAGETREGSSPSLAFVLSGAPSRSPSVPVVLLWLLLAVILGGLGGLGGYHQAKLNEFIQHEYQRLGGVILAPEPADRKEMGRAGLTMGLVVLLGTLVTALVGGAWNQAWAAGAGAIVCALLLAFLKGRLQR